MNYVTFIKSLQHTDNFSPVTILTFMMTLLG